MRLRTLGALCATSAVAPLTTLVPAASAQMPPVQPAVAPPGDLRAGAIAMHANRHVYAARRYRQLRGDPLSLPERRAMRLEVAQLAPAALRAATRDLLGDIRRLRQRLRLELYGGARPIPIPPQLESIAACESRGNPRVVSSGGTYRGKYQFSFSTWRSVGGRGDPAAASEIEQDRRAAKLYRTGGPRHWPVCGR